MLLDDGEKVTFVIKWQRTWWDYVLQEGHEFWGNQRWNVTPKFIG